MALIWNKWIFLFLLTGIFAASAARADASAVALGSDKLAWSTKINQQAANKDALEKCNELSAKKDCKLDQTKFIAEARGGSRQSWGRSSVDMASAKKTALKGCGEADCKISTEISSPGFYSLAQAISDQDGKDGSYLTHGYTDRDNSNIVAKQNCLKNVGRECELVWSGAIPGNKPSDYTKTVVSGKSCRPQTASIKCSSQCQNESCIVSYENGCKIRVQVQPTFDAFTNQWKYPTPSC